MGVCTSSTQVSSDEDEEKTPAERNINRRRRTDFPFPTYEEEHKIDKCTQVNSQDSDETKNTELKEEEPPSVQQPTVSTSTAPRVIIPLPSYDDDEDEKEETSDEEGSKKDRSIDQNDSSVSEDEEEDVYHSDDEIYEWTFTNFFPRQECADLMPFHILPFLPLTSLLQLTRVSKQFRTFVHRTQIYDRFEVKKVYDRLYWKIRKRYPHSPFDEVEGESRDRSLRIARKIIGRYRLRKLRIDYTVFFESFMTSLSKKDISSNELVYLDLSFSRWYAGMLECKDKGMSILMRKLINFKFTNVRDFRFNLYHFQEYKELRDSIPRYVYYLQHLLRDMKQLETLTLTCHITRDLLPLELDGVVKRGLFLNVYHVHDTTFLENLKIDVPVIVTFHSSTFWRDIETVGEGLRRTMEGFSRNFKNRKLRLLLTIGELKFRECVKREESSRYWSVIRRLDLYKFLRNPTLVALGLCNVIINDEIFENMFKYMTNHTFERLFICGEFSRPELVYHRIQKMYEMGILSPEKSKVCVETRFTKWDEVCPEIMRGHFNLIGYLTDSMKKRKNRKRRCDENNIDFKEEEEDGENEDIKDSEEEEEDVESEVDEESGVNDYYEGGRRKYRRKRDFDPKKFDNFCSIFNLDCVSTKVHKNWSIKRSSYIQKKKNQLEFMC